MVIMRNNGAPLERLDLCAQAVRPGHLAHIPPERFLALVEHIMQHQEVADPVIFQIHQPVIFIDIRSGTMRLRKQREQVQDAALDQIDAG